MIKTIASKLAPIKSLVNKELIELDTLIKQRLFSKTPLISEVCHYLLSNGGKRLRPLLLLLSAQLFNYQGEESVFVAAIIELLHAATLLHDDVIDNSELRHHRKTANAIWGNTGSVLVGDYLHVLSFQMLNELANSSVTNVIVSGTRITVEGEVMQLMHRNMAHITESQYTEIICNKTAQFFTVAGQLGAIIAKRSEQEITHMAHYGTHLGLAYQLMDDALDYSAKTIEIGKNIGDDLRDGKPTLPIIYAMQHTSPKNRAIIQDAIVQGDIEKLDTVLNILQETGALEYTLEQARQHIKQAITFLPSDSSSINSQAYSALQQLAEFVVCA